MFRYVYMYVIRLIRILIIVILIVRAVEDMATWDGKGDE